MNKFLVAALVMSSALVAPSFAFAQSNAPVTRAQVRAELIQLENAGYTPGGEQADYPQNLLAAEQRVADQQRADVGSYGASSNGTTASGAPINVSLNTRSTYFGH